jgi:hypothetical protein
MKTKIVDGIKYEKVEQLSIEEMMKEVDMTREEVISATEEATIWSTDYICIDGELYREL